MPQKPKFLQKTSLFSKSDACECQQDHTTFPEIAVLKAKRNGVDI